MALANAPWPGKSFQTPMSSANRYRLTSPSQKTGAEISASDPVIVVRSIIDRRLIAEMIPIVSPTLSQMITAPVTSQIVAGRREKIS